MIEQLFYGSFSDKCIELNCIVWTSRLITAPGCALTGGVSLQLFKLSLDDGRYDAGLLLSGMGELVLRLYNERSKYACILTVSR